MGDVVEPAMPKIQGDEEISIMLVGGGARYPAFIGALQAIEEKGLRISKIIGSSTGSIVGSLYACGKSPAEMYREALKVDSGQFRKISLSSIFRNYGLCSGNELEKWLDGQFERRRFGDRLRYPLQVVATDMLHYQPVIFSAETFPGITLAAAATASTAVPWVFGYRDLSAGGNKYALLDGSLMSGVVERRLNRSGKTLIFKVASKRNLNHPHHQKLTFRDYFVEVISFGMHAQEKEFMRAGKWKDTILLFCSDISPARFQLTRDETTYLYQQGYEQTMTYLEYKWGI